MIKARLTSSLEKVFIDDKVESYPELKSISVLKGERLSFQLVYQYEKDENGSVYAAERVPLNITGTLAEYASVRYVAHVPVNKPVSDQGYDDNYLRTCYGMYPDILRPMYYDGTVTMANNMVSSLWIEVNIPEDITPGEHSITLSFADKRLGCVDCALAVEIIDAELPKEDIYFTQWFHADCLANYYNVDVWSERHWEIVEEFVKTARRNGINTLLTPVFTPPLDTKVGGERRTTQLVGVTVTDGKYSFDFSRLGRWIDMCDRCGIDNLEISHLFTQWGAAHAPKIMATVDGEYKRIFGWETNATGEEYSSFLRLFISELLTYLKARGDDKRCIFHISDEPGIDHLENYKSAKQIVADLLDGYLIVDALSKYDFYQTGALTNPIPASNHIAPFIEGGVKNLWTYYCCTQALKVSNRFITMPSWRTRCIGMQIFKYNIVGFLHWGYNFYNNQYSEDPINPYYELSSDFAFPAGDAFSVYPAQDGTAIESLRIVVFHEALQDIKAMKLAEKYYGHEAVVAEIEKIFGRELTFDTCVKSAEVMLLIREKINEMIKNAL